MISSHKRNIVNVMRSVSRLSRRVSGGDVNSLPFPFSEVPLLHKKTAEAVWKSKRHCSPSQNRALIRGDFRRKSQAPGINRGKQGRVRSPEFSLPRSGGIHAVRQRPQTAAMLISPRLWRRRALRGQTQRLFRRRDKTAKAHGAICASPVFWRVFS